MKYFGTICLTMMVVFVCLQVGHVRAEGELPDMLSEYDLEAFVANMSGKEGRKWPKIDLKSGEKLTADEKENQAELVLLAQTLFKKIKEYDLDCTDESFEDLRRISNTLIQLSGILRRNRGYVNYVLADVCHRIVLGRVASYLVIKRDNFQHLEKLLMSIPNPFKRTEVIALFEDCGFLDTQSRLAEVRPREFLNGVSQILGIDEAVVYKKVNNESLKTSNLMKNKDLFSYTYRVLNTQLIAQVSLPGTIEFLKKGGTAQDVRFGTDITEFKKTMGDSREKYSCPYWGVKRLRPSDIRYVLDSFGVDHHGSTFSRIGSQ